MKNHGKDRKSTQNTKSESTFFINLSIKISFLLQEEEKRMDKQ